MTIELNKAQGEWEYIDAALRSISRQRGLLDASEARWIREALRVKIWREVACVSMVDYLERRLGYAPRTASDRIRVAQALEDLPKVAEALGRGLPYTAVRELTRVATRENEERWLDAVRGKTVHEIEGMVSGRGRGANPDDPAHPSLAGRTLPFEGVRQATEALVRDARRMLQSERGGGVVVTDDEVLAALARAFLEGGKGERTKAPYQIAVTLCELCGRGWQDSGGKKFELSAADIDLACCDAERIGSLDADNPERATQDVTPAKRRLVRRRDRGRCRVPGCRSTRCLEIHHIVARILGGSHDLENMILICDSCHAALHRGLLSISGTSSDLVVTRRHTFELAASEIPDAYDDLARDEGDDLLGSQPTEDNDELATRGPSAHVGSPRNADNDVDNDELAPRGPSAHVGTPRNADNDEDDELAPRGPSAHVGRPRNADNDEDNDELAPRGPSAHVGSPRNADNDEDNDEIATRRPSAHVGRPRNADNDEPAPRGPRANVGSLYSEREGIRFIPIAAGDNAYARGPRPSFERERLRSYARAALVGLGFRPEQAGPAVDLAMRSDDGAPIEDILRMALRSLRPATGS